MHQSVIDAFPLRFSAPLEGNVRSLYADVRGLLTVGIGCLADPLSSALALDWRMPDGSRATPSEIAKQWLAVKAQAPELAKRHWKYAADVTTMRLSDAGVIALAQQRLAANETHLRAAFSAWDSWPADAQLFACSMAWAVGAGWPAIFGNCSRILRATPPGFLLAATAPANALPNEAVAACDIRTTSNPGIVPRNAQNRLCLSNAQVVVDRGLDVSVLHWPSSPLLDGTT